MASSPPCLRGVDGRKRLILRIQLGEDATTCVSLDPDESAADLFETLENKGQGEHNWVLTTGKIGGGAVRRLRPNERIGDVANKQSFICFGPGGSNDATDVPAAKLEPKAAVGVFKKKGAYVYGESKIRGTYHKDPSTYHEPNEMVLRYFPALGDQVFSRPLMGVESQHGMMPDDSNKTSEGKINQDRGCYKYPFCGNPRCAFFGVFDGHGAEGHLVSEFVIGVIANQVERHMLNGSDPEAAMKAAFVETEEKLVKVKQIDSSTSGCTAVGCVVIENEIWTANVGDSRAVIGRTGGEGNRLLCIELTEDQKPNSPIERSRILSMGGYVSPETANESSRVFVEKDGAGGLALGRAIGDTMVGEVGVISEPVVTHHTFTSEDKCLILASDGIWEYISSQEAVEFVSQHASASRAAASIKEEAMERWKKEGLYRDDITVGVIYPPFW